MTSNPIEIIKAHGCRNDVVLVPAAPTELFGGDTARQTRAVRYLCDRRGPFGADGVYFIDVTSGEPQTWYFNADGSYAEYCGNGLRCAGRWLLEFFGTRTLSVMSGGVRFEVRALPDVDGVRRVSVASERPVRFLGFGSSNSPLRHDLIPEYSPRLRFTAFNGPNPHLVTSVSSYDEADLVRIGSLATADRKRFRAGVNTTMVMPIEGQHKEFFARTYERGAGLTPSCASGAVAAASMLVSEGIVREGEGLTIHNAGGDIDVMIEGSRDDLYPTQAGNASFVYSSVFDFGAFFDGRVEPYVRGTAFGEEIDAFAARHDTNLRLLASAGISVTD